MTVHAGEGASAAAAAAPSATQQDFLSPLISPFTALEQTGWLQNLLSRTQEGGAGPLLAPAFKTSETDQDWRMSVHLPGVPKEELKVQVFSGMELGTTLGQR